MAEKSKSLSYRGAGVDIDRADALVEDIKLIAKRTERPGVLAGIGGFGALFELPLDRYKNPVLVSSTDGVGTKLRLAIEMSKHDTVGIDLVAMCVNDLITLGAEPLFFLDYFATGKIKPEAARQIISGIGQGCEQAGAALIGGETAEMPGMYHNNDYDLAGFCVGVVEKNNIIDGSDVQPNDVLLGVASSGTHSNGYSLIRKVLEHKNIDLNKPFSGSTLGDVLLTPTRIYIRSLLNLIKAIKVKAMANITGGGLYENIPRVLPKHSQAVIEQNSWQWPEIFQWLQQQGNIEDYEMMRTFNVGVGMVVCVAQADADQAIEQLQSSGEKVWIIGSIEKSDQAKPKVVVR